MLDVTIKGTPVRLVASHGPAQSSPHVKKAHYEAIGEEIRRIQREDKVTGDVSRASIWMADHNMVENYKRDEE